MGQGVSRLTAVEVKNLSAPGRYGDGDGLYLEVRKDGAKVWLLRYQLRGRRRDMSLGVVTAKNGLAVARLAAQEARGLIAKGIDPIDARKRPAGVLTFGEQADKLIDDLSPGWRGKRTRYNWELSLTTHAAKLRAKRVDAITTEDVLAVLKPLWSANAESAGKLRERIERVLDAGRAANPAGDWANPARWKGHLALMLPKLKKLSKGHLKAMPYADAPAFVQAIRMQDSMGARALEWTILTAARESMTLGMPWREAPADVWTIPAERMKLGKEHRVPLSTAAIALRERVAIAGRPASGHVFPGRKDKPLGSRTMDDVLKRMKLPYTVHGFRSTFRDWAGDCTAYPRDLIEEALAHQVGDEVERAYRRSDALEKRRQLMQDWADFLAKPPAVPPADG